MTLKLYKSKRSLKASGEPGSSKKAQKKGALTFVIQKHAARRLHYDFRLELDGVLKSWAIPKEPLLDPSVKRLAIEVEDHPLAYGSFAGTIPEGNYGAGKVEIWDNGTYEVEGEKDKAWQEKIMRQKFKNGELTFTLHGKKMKGLFTLVKMHDPKDNQWLFFKRKEEEPKKKAQSTSKAVKKSSASDSESISYKELPHTSIPHHIKPMLAHLVEAPFNRKGWIFEMKWDGYRALAEVSKKQISLYSRNFLSFNAKFPKIVADLEALQGDFVFDGEIVALDAEGHSNFQLLQNYLNEQDKPAALKYCIFDLLYCRGHDLRDLPLIERKKILKEILAPYAHTSLYYSDYIETKGKAFFKKIVQNKLEGMMAKEAHSSYVSLRSRSWLKIKTHQRQELVIGGFTQPKGGRKLFGAIVVGVYKDGKLVYAGHTGGGFDQKTLKIVYVRLQPLITTKCPFTIKPKTNMPVTWVKPKLICEVSFQEWTKDGSMRQPVFEGLRGDKPPKKIQKEIPVDLEATSQKAEAKKSSKPSLASIISHPKKVLWPETHYTKQNLLEYYQNVSAYLLPHVKNRPLVMHRFPNGIDEPSFYHKEAPESIPSWIKTHEVEHSEKNMKYILGQNLETILYVANLGSIEIHPFLSRITKIHYPDFLVLDIDPNDLPFQIGVEVALETHRILSKLDLPHYCKTSGKRGLHIYLPLNAKYEYAVVENFAKLLASLVHEALPEKTSLIRDPSKRQKKVYVDYLQNGYTKTVVAPYSVRPTEEATVSAPIEWSELTKKLNPAQFTIKTMLKRLEKKGDLFMPVLDKGLNISKVINIIE